MFEVFVEERENPVKAQTVMEGTYMLMYMSMYSTCMSRRFDICSPVLESRNCMGSIIIIFFLLWYKHINTHN